MASASPQSLKRGTLLCGGAYSIRALLGCGSFGAVYDAVDMRSGCGVALKTEALSAASPQLGIEWMALDRHLRYKEGIPRVIWFGPCEDAGVEVLVMQRLGASVDALRAAVAAAGGDASANIVAPLPLYVVQYIALQALERLQSCHDRDARQVARGHAALRVARRTPRPGAESPRRPRVVAVRAAALGARRAAVAVRVHVCGRRCCRRCGKGSTRWRRRRRRRRQRRR
jgi:serine/threonine protein kinase